MDNYIRKKLLKKDIKKNYSEKIEFQILEWFKEDYEEESEDSEEPESKLIIRLFGVTDKGHSINVSVSGFEPFFYIKVPENWNLGHKNKLMETLSQKLYKNKKYISLENCKLLKRKIFYGFQNEKKHKFIRLNFKNLKTFYIARKIFLENNINNIKFELFEHKIDIILKFIHTHHIGSIGWVKFDYEKATSGFETKCQIEYNLDIKHLEGVERFDIAPFRQMSYDIECYSHDKNKFPRAENIEDCVTQIGSSFQTFGKDEIDFQHIITIGKCAKLNTEGAVLECYDKEKEALLAWTDLINKTDPDIIYGYNNHGFDDEYLFTRAKLNNVKDKFCRMSRLNNHPSELKEASFNSSAYGNSKWNILAIHGRLNFDLLVYIRREFKLDSYKMDSAADSFLKSSLKNCLVNSPELNSNIFEIKNEFINKFKLGQQVTFKDETEIQELGRITKIQDNKITTEKLLLEPIEQECDVTLNIQKNPVTPKMIFASFEEKDPIKIRDVADYCLQDTKIPLQLVDSLNIFVNCVQMALVTSVPFSFLISKGQQIKVLSQILKETKKRDFVIPDITPRITEFQGATVLPPRVGAYFVPTVVLDFASLYPSIIRAHNFCYSSLVLDPEYDNLPGVEYKTIEWSDEPDKDGNVRKNKYKFVQNIETVIPDILKDLTIQRKNVRTDMKTEKDKLKYMVMDGFQKALKVSANSIYGFLSAQTLQCTPIGACTTAMGRKMIAETKEYIDGNFKNFETIYGDSVIGETPITLRKDGKICVKYIKDLGKNWTEYNQFNKEGFDKKQSECDYEVFTGDGWCKIVRVIQHRTKKRIFKVKTKKGVVYVTEDHSLLSNLKIPIKPVDCVVGTKLWHKRITA